MTVSASQVDLLALAGVAAALGLLAVLVARHRPLVGLVTYVALLAMVPAWLGMQVVVFVTPATGVGVALVLAAWRRVDLRVHAVDLVMLGVVLAVVTAFAVGDIPLAPTYAVLVGWLVPYAVGRVVSLRLHPSVIATVVGAVLGVVALLGLLEHLTGTNLFVGLGAGSPFAEGSGYRIWSVIQERGGQARVEVAFGHSIALGATLGLAVPFLWVSRLRPVLKGAALLAVGACSVFTYSRIGMISVGLALVLSLVLLGHAVTRRFRVTVSVALAVAAAVVVPTALEVFSSAGDEAEGSAQYRGDLTSLVPRMAWLGQSAAAAQDAAGTRSFGGFESIDSALILVGLTYGLLPLLLLLAAACAAVVGLLRRRREAPLVAVVALLPALTSVAFITQFTTFFWFVVGLAVATGDSRAGEPRDAPLSSTDEEHPPAWARAEPHDGSIVRMTGDDA